MVLKIDEIECSDYCIWLNGKKINNALDISKNFDLTSLRGYLLGGSLINWLKNHSGGDIATYLNKYYLPGADVAKIDINLLLTCAFGIEEKSKYEIKKIKQYKRKHKIFGRSSFFGVGSIIHSFINTKKDSSFFTSYFKQRGSQASFKAINSNSFFWTSQKSSFITSLSGSFIIMDKNCINIDKIEMLLEICPLNRFGYGIHLI